MLTTSNLKSQNYKLIDLIKGYNFNIKCILVQHHKKDIIFKMRQAQVRDYYDAEILYYFLSILTSSNKKIQN